VKKKILCAAGVVVLSTAIASMTTYAAEMGAAARNGHRNGWSSAVRRVQNMDYCISTKGHPAVRMPTHYRCINRFALSASGPPASPDAAFSFLTFSADGC